MLVILLRSFFLSTVFILIVKGVSFANSEKRVPLNKLELSLSFAPLIKLVSPSVVNIYTRRVVRDQIVSPLFNDPFFRQFFGEQFSRGMRTRKRVQNSLGSGVILAANGLIVTNYHVVDKADEITVVLHDRREFDAVVVTRDERTDLAVLKIRTKGKNFPFLELRDSDALEVGDIVLAIGNPFGVGQTVTSGIVSALARTAKGVSDFNFFIQTDAAINPGNSGGALISLDGKLVGINTAIYSRGGGSNGIGFAIPSNMVATVIGSGTKDGKVVRPWLGARGQSVNSAIAQSLKLSRPTGVLINSIHSGGPADRGGLKIGDVIVAVNDRPVLDVNALRFRIATLRLNSIAKFTVVKGTKISKLRIKLVAAPATPKKELSVIEGNNPYSGAEVANLSPALAEELLIDTMLVGVIITRIKRGSAAARIGLRPGDILYRLNGRNIDSVAMLKSLLSERQSKWKIEIKRGARKLQLILRN